MKLPFILKKPLISLGILSILNGVIWLFIELNIWKEIFKINSLFYFLLLTAISVIYILIYRGTKSWLKGLEGEGEVRKILEKLSGFYHIKDIVIGNRGNIDFAVIGSSGIWTIEVKNTKGKIWFNGDELEVGGYRTNYLSQAYAEAKTLEKIFLKKYQKEIHAKPVIVIANKKAKISFGKRQIKGVYIIGINWLEKLLTEDKSEYLANEEIEKIVKMVKEIKEENS